MGRVDGANRASSGWESNTLLELKRIYAHLVSSLIKKCIWVGSSGAEAIIADWWIVIGQTGRCVEMIIKTGRGGEGKGCDIGTDDGGINPHIISI